MAAIITKVMISGASCKSLHNTERQPCGVCGRGVDKNSIQCTGNKCQKWVHKKCSGIKASMIKVSKSFVCRGCTDQQASVDRTSTDIADGASLEFCYVGDMLSVECRW